MHALFTLIQEGRFRRKQYSYTFYNDGVLVCNTTSEYIRVKAYVVLPENRIRLITLDKPTRCIDLGCKNLREFLLWREGLEDVGVPRLREHEVSRFLSFWDPEQVRTAHSTLRFSSCTITA